MGQAGQKIWLKEEQSHHHLGLYGRIMLLLRVAAAGSGSGLLGSAAAYAGRKDTHH